jgi:tetratricopeptide (TPR) repeat protein
VGHRLCPAEDVNLQQVNAMLICKRSAAGILIVAIWAHATLFFAPAQAQLRKIKVGDKLPEFSLPDADGTGFEHKHDRGRVLGVVFLSPNQNQSERAVNEIGHVLDDLRKKEAAFDFIGVVSENGDSNSLTPATSDANLPFPVFLDAEYKLWGKFGIIATPTVLVTDDNDSVLWIKAGYGYDFAPALRGHLSQALGLLGDSQVQETTQVETVHNNTVLARVSRHIQMAKILEQKGQVEAAVAEIRRARLLDPNSVPVAIALAELLCRTNQSQAALDAVAGVNASERIQKAGLLLISGWAKRQLGQLDDAENLLLQATALDPKSSRAFFELGKVYQIKQEPQKAMHAYRRALALLFAEPIEQQNSHQQ